MKQTELRCKCCKTLLGMMDEDGITIHRGGMQATFSDAQMLTAAIVCYRCSKVNLFTLAGKKPRA